MCVSNFLLFIFYGLSVLLWLSSHLKEACGRKLIRLCRNREKNFYVTNYNDKLALGNLIHTHMNFASLICCVSAAVRWPQEKHNKTERKKKESEKERTRPYSQVGMSKFSIKHKYFRWIMSPSQSHLDQRRQADESHQAFHKQSSLTEKVSSQSDQKWSTVALRLLSETGFEG